MHIRKKCEFSESTEVYIINQTLYIICEKNLQYPDKVITKMSLKDNEEDFNNVHIMNPFVHKLKLENTFDKFKVRAKHHNKISSVYKYHYAIKM